MIKIFIFCLLLSLAGKLFSQADKTGPNPSVKTDYLQKSKNQKAVAWGLLATGTAMMGTGLLMIGTSAESEGVGPSESAIIGAAFFSTGLVMDIVSIAFFIAGGSNKRRSLSVSFKNELAPQVRPGSIVQTALPSVSLVIKL